MLEAALGLALPEGKAFFSFVNHMIEGAKKMKEKVEEMRKYTELVDKVLETQDAASKVSTAYQNAPLGMISTIDSITDQLISRRRSTMRLGAVFKSLRGVKSGRTLFQFDPVGQTTGLSRRTSQKTYVIFSSTFWCAWRSSGSCA